MNVVSQLIGILIRIDFSVFLMEQHRIIARIFVNTCRPRVKLQLSPVLFVDEQGVFQPVSRRMHNPEIAVVLIRCEIVLNLQ